ncbi:MAG TPA: DMT family transporter [Anaerolineales bacterium]|nr:DMT family transporter [Anaerolineales bacterium]HRQ92293.1 DMT family transporter [Anaerolineales bacterium]
MKRKDLLAFVALSLAWGSAFYWIKVALEQLQPFTLVAWRLLLGGVLLGLTAWFKRAALPRGWAQWWPLLMLGLINIAIPLVITTSGQQFIDTGVASIVLSTVPLFTVILAYFTLKEDALNRWQLAGLLVGFAGVVLLLLRDVGGGQSTLWGYASHLIAALLYAASAVFARKALHDHSVIVQALVPTAFSGALVWAAVPFVESPIQAPTQLMPLLGILFLGGVSSYLAYMLYYYLIRAIGPARMSMTTYTFPLVGILLGVLFLNEALDAYLLLGGALVLGSVLVVNRS